MSNVGGATNNT